MAKNWTTKEVAYVQKHALLAETNEVLNVTELAKKLNRTFRSIEAKIYKMRKDEMLPALDHTKAFDARNRLYSQSVDKRIISMYKQGSTYAEIGEAVGRSEQSIACRVMRLKKNGLIEKSKICTWTNEEIQTVIRNIKFDENGYVSNYQELTSLVDKRYTQIQQKVCVLRKQGLITVQADKSKTSVKSKEAMDKFNKARFAQYKKEDNPVVEKTAKTDVKVETQSKMIQVIMTTIITGEERTTSFFTSEGELLAVKKEEF